MNKRIGLFGGALLAAGAPSTASADVFTDRAAFEGAYPGLPNLDFEGYAPDGGFIQPAPDFSAFGVTFTDGDTGTDALTAIVDSAGFANTPTDAFFINAFQATADMFFSPPVLAVGMEVATGFGGFGATVDVFDPDDTLIATETFDTESENIFTTFIGFGNLGDIARIIVTPLDGGFTLLDDVTFGVPAPSSIALLGLGGLVATRRRR